MNKQELKDIVKKYFHLEDIAEESTQEVENVQFKEAELIDDTKVTNMVDADFEVGQELHVITEENEHVLAPSGMHELKDGTVVTVDGSGIITGIRKEDGEAEGSLEEEAAPVSEEMAEHPEDVVEEAMEDMDIKEVIVEAIAEVVAPELEMLKKKMADMEEKMKKHYAAEPAAKSSLENKFSKSNNDPLSFLDSKFNRNQARYEAIVNKK